MRVFIGLYEIAGYYIRLHKALRKIGVKSDYFCEFHPFNYANLSDYDTFLGKVLFLLTKYKFIFTKFKTKFFSAKRFSKIFFNILIAFTRVLIFFYSLIKYDVFIFSFSGSILNFLNYLDLPFLKKFRKKIICCVFHGSEARPRYIDFYGLDFSNTDKLLCDLRRIVERQKRNLETIEKYSDVIIGSYLTSHFLKKKFIDYLYIGYISPFFDNQDIDSEKNGSENLIILHSPSNPIHKGTDEIRKAMENIRKCYNNVEYVELVGKDYYYIQGFLKNCSFVVDQLYSDTPLAGLGTEAAVFGKPTITGGYVWDKLKSIYDENVLAPSYLCRSEEIEKAIEEMILNKELREDLGKKVKKFVEENWAPQKVAEKFLQIINGNIPQHWYREPIDNYAHFALIGKDKGKELLKLYIERFGEEALFLDDKPLLKKAFLDLAFS